MGSDVIGVGTKSAAHSPAAGQRHLKHAPQVNAFKVYNISFTDEVARYYGMRTRVHMIHTVSSYRYHTGIIIVV